ncbi:MAG: hypothetical protein DME17_06675 [Candidatus Rokuibacteriota bacterium]|nr:MAG: hypothetical protein DME17_06675 [Candidatus Rokubacteria bacterium]
MESGQRTKAAGQKTSAAGQSSTRGRDVESTRTFAGVGHLFAGRAVVTLLRLFFLHPSRDFYQRELTAMTGERLFLIQSALKRLIRAGIVGQTWRGNRTYYRVDPSHPAHEPLKALMLITVGFGDSLRAQLLGIRDKIKVAFLYGSVARGDETATSDIDLMLIGNLSGRQTAAVLAPVKRLVNREINPSVYNPQDFRRKYRNHHPFIRDVIKGPKVFLLGDEGELKAILGGRST